MAIGERGDDPTLAAARRHVAHDARLDCNGAVEVARSTARTGSERSRPSKRANRKTRSSSTWPANRRALSAEPTLRARDSLIFAPHSRGFRLDPMRAVDCGGLPSVSVSENLRGALHLRSPLA